MHMQRPCKVCQNAITLLESYLRLQREKVWKLLMTEKNIDLSSAIPYLIKQSKTDSMWQTLDSRGKDFVYE